VLHLVRRWPTFSWKIVEIRALPHLGLPTIQAPSRIVIVEPSGSTNVTVRLPNSNPTLSPSYGRILAGLRAQPRSDHSFVPCELEAATAAAQSSWRVWNSMRLLARHS
jgi:hypothetical protein